MGPCAGALHDAHQSAHLLVDLVGAARLGAFALILAQESNVDLVQRHRAELTIERANVLLQIRQRPRGYITRPAARRHRARVNPRLGSFGKDEVWME